MRKFWYSSLVILLLPVIVYLCSCAGGTVIDKTDPITPAPELTEGTVNPETRAITITKEGITVTMEHWSRTKLNRKYTTVDMRSPFYYLETWEQSFKSEVFHVKIENNGPRNITVNLEETIMQDEREYKYNVQTIDEFKFKFVTKKMMDLKTKRGLEEAGWIMLNEIVRSKKTIPPGDSIEGFISFPETSSIVTKPWIKLVVEREPEVVTASYEKIEFRFDFVQDPIVRSKQPPIKR
jgi:hypothetical protein